MNPRLENHRVFACRNDEELHAFLNSKNFKMEIKPNEANVLDARFNGIYMPGMFLGYIQYGSPISTCADGRDDYWLQMPLSGHMEISYRDRSVVCHPGLAGLASPTHHNYYNMNSSVNSGGIRVCVYRSTIVDALSMLLGSAPDKPLIFNPEMDLTKGYGNSLIKYLMATINDFEQSDSLYWTQALQQSFEQFFLSALLISHNHNYSDALYRLDCFDAPYAVKQAIEFIRENSSDHLSINDIVAVANIPGRTLFKRFRDYTGLSPMQFLINVRFEKVRKRLLSSDQSAHVTSIALEEGFVHMGRFSVEYRKRYGEKPSETLRRR